MVALRVRNAKSACPQSSGGLRKGSSRNQRRAWNLQQNLRRERQRATHRNQRSPSRNVQSSSKLKHFFAVFVTAANKHWNCQRQAGPLAAFSLWPLSVQGESFYSKSCSSSTASVWPNPRANRKVLEHESIPMRTLHATVLSAQALRPLVLPFICLRCGV